METKIVFRLTTVLSTGDYVPLGEFTNAPLPQVGSIINVDGDPFIVHKASYVYYENDPITHGYVYVFKAGSFKLRIGKKNY